MRVIVETGRVPRVAETASALGRMRDEVDAAHRLLGEGHIFVLEPGTSELRMANPTVDEAESIFTSLGLVGDFWKLRR
jgi:hypothetical protein